MRKRKLGIVWMLICVMFLGTMVNASGAYVKDSAEFVESASGTSTYAKALEESLTNQLERMYGEAVYTGYKVYDNGSEYLVSVVSDGEKIGWHLVAADGIIQQYVHADHKHIFVRESYVEKITDELMGKMEESSEDVIPVYVWLKDIDTEDVLSAMPASMSAQMRSGDEASVQTYIEQKRETLSAAYEAYNNDFVNGFFSKDLNSSKERSLDTIAVAREESNQDLFISRYAPMCLLNLSVEQIYEMAKDSRVSEIGFLPEVEYEPLAIEGAASVQGDYVRDTNGYTGEGAIVGILEAGGLPDRSLSVLAGANIHVNEDIPQVTDNHASRVAAIICGQPVRLADGTVQTVGMAPDCTVYATYTVKIEGSSIVQKQGIFMDQMEWLIEQGVHVINVSMGVACETNEYGTYTLVDKWVDHIDMHHDILVVTAAGNNEDLSHRVAPPALSFNGITVGAYGDNGTAGHGDDYFWNNSSYIEIESEMDSDPQNDGDLIPHAEKPDLLAPGVAIGVPGLADSASGNTGTSFAAPFVTATVAQMIDAKPELKTQPAILKAALLASAFRNVSALNDTPIGGRLYDKTGAGKLDAKNAIYVIMSGNYTYEYFWADTTTHTISIYVDASETQMRVALTWLKQSVLNDLPSNTPHDALLALDLDDNRPLSDWNLYVTDPDGGYVSSSSCENGNVEVVSFDPSKTGYYTITITKIGGANEKEFVYLAWW